MKKITLIIVLCLSTATLVLAQDAPEKTGFDKSRMFFGGNLGLSFSSYSTAIYIAPLIGYKFSDHFVGGGGISYAYYSYKEYYVGNYSRTYNSSYAGINLFGRFFPIRQLFIQVQPELNYVWGDNYYAKTPDKKVSEFVPSLLLGGGAALPAGPGAIVISVSYDVIQNNLSPYYQQVVYAFGYNMSF